MWYRIAIGALVAFGFTVSAWATSASPSITVTYEKPYTVKEDNSVQVMNAYHLSSSDVSGLSTASVQAIKSTCGTSTNIQLVSKNVAERQVLFCGSNDKALNIPTGDVVMSVKSCPYGAACP